MWLQGMRQEFGSAGADYFPKKSFLIRVFLTETDTGTQGRK